jgi:hypothetical protein
MQTKLITLYLTLAIIVTASLLFIFITIDTTTDLKTGQAYNIKTTNAKDFAQVNDYLHTCLEEKFQNNPILLQRAFETCINNELFPTITITQEEPIIVTIENNKATITTKITLQRESYSTTLTEFILQ